MNFDYAMHQQQSYGYYPPPNQLQGMPPHMAPPMQPPQMQQMPQQMQQPQMSAPMHQQMPQIQQPMPQPQWPSYPSYDQPQQAFPTFSGFDQGQNGYQMPSFSNNPYSVAPPPPAAQSHQKQEPKPNHFDKLQTEYEYKQPKKEPQKESSMGTGTDFREPSADEIPRQNRIERVINLSRVPKKEQSDIICFLCKDILHEDSCACKKCKTTFCSACLDKYQRSNRTSKCPTPNECGSQIRGGTLVKKTKTNLAILKFRCLNTSLGCKKELKLEEISKHDLECKMRCVQCMRCSKLVTIAEKAAHQAQCSTKADETCKLCGAVIRPNMHKDHQRKCMKAQVACSGEDCKHMTTRDQIGQHEEQCDRIKENCAQCQASVPRYLQSEHDCVKALLEKFRAKGKELNEYTDKVDKLALEIHKQQLILEKLNLLNNEKQKRIADIETLFEIQSSGGQKQFSAVSSDRAPDLLVSYAISQNIKNSIIQAKESVYAGTIHGQDTKAGKEFMERMLTNKLTPAELAQAGTTDEPKLPKSVSINEMCMMEPASKRQRLGGTRDRPKREYRDIGHEKAIQYKLDTAQQKVGMFDDYRTDKQPVLGNKPNLPSESLLKPDLLHPKAATGCKCSAKTIEKRNGKSIMVGECQGCSHGLCKACKYSCEYHGRRPECKGGQLCSSCCTQCQMCFVFTCEGCRCSCSK